MGTPVLVIKGAGRKCLALRWTDPLTGQVSQKSAKTTNHKEAERAAGKLQAELNEGRYSSPLQFTWDDFRERVETEHLPSLAKPTQPRRLLRGVLS